ncbi:uncharacterized protein LOC113513732 [Galleria mellonella]|uniref:Uncharacterized protein LOC113513732 n=1 Tax=Galleria mellonella TaxID=7137 RepID=A0A6J1WH69_GALME|nr:uncharacterized protein LOC113513732 [Galleria mellonella]
MEDVYTIKVKSKPDTRNLYPSERRYSASTVSGLAWVHIALAATSLLLACLAIINPNSQLKLSNNITDANKTELLLNTTESNENATGNITDECNNGNRYVLVLAPTLIAVFALAAGITSILASVRWYIDHNITWLFVMSVISTVASFTSFIMIVAWFIATAEGDMSEFYKERIPFKDYIVVKHTDVINRNGSHMIVSLNSNTEETNSYLFTKRVLSINILIAAFLELLWSLLSVKISYKGMRNNYKDDSNERRGNCISVVTTIKGNDPKNMPRNGKLMPPKPDLIEHYPSKKIKRIFLAQSDNGFYLKNQNNKAKQNTETSSEFYKERMMNFLNRCASLEMSNTEMRTPSIQSEAVLNPIPEIASVDINIQENNTENEVKDCITPVSWGDTPDHTVYNQNTINFDKIFKFGKKKEGDSEKPNEISENTE